MKLLGIAVMFLVFLNCSTPKEDKDDTTDRVGTTVESKSDSVPVSDIDYSNIQSYLTEDSINHNDLAILDEDCAVIVYPTELQIERMKKEYGEEDFFTVAEDGSYYHGMANILLDSLKVKTVSPEKSFVRFLGNKKDYTIHIRKEGFPEWNLFFFKKGKEPAVIGTAGLTAEVIRDYFKNER